MLTDSEIRTLAIDLLKEATDRDRQVRIGASNLSNQCDRCLAHNFIGEERKTPITDRAWLGRVLGTAFHWVLDVRVKGRIARMARELDGALSEHHVWFAEFEGYGKIGGTIDLLLSALQLIDWKGSTRKKIALLIDYLASTIGQPPIFGRTHKNIKLSEREYADQMAKMAYAVNGYYGQQNLYMHGSGARRASLVFVARDGTGFFDNPDAARYEDPTAVHDVYVLSFDYDQAYAEALIARGAAIWKALQAGAKPSDFASHPLCFPCSAGAIDSLPDIEVSFGGVAA